MSCEDLDALLDAAWRKLPPQEDETSVPQARVIEQRRGWLFAADKLIGDGLHEAARELLKTCERWENLNTGVVRGSGPPRGYVPPQH